MLYSHFLSTNQHHSQMLHPGATLRLIKTFYDSLLKKKKKPYILCNFYLISSLSFSVKSVPVYSYVMKRRIIGRSRNRRTSAVCSLRATRLNTLLVLWLCLLLSQEERWQILGQSQRQKKKKQQQQTQRASALRWSGTLCPWCISARTDLERSALRSGSIISPASPLQG